MQLLTLSVKLFTTSYKLEPHSTEGTGGLQGIGGFSGGGQKFGKSGLHLLDIKTPP
jgi:hypothetical protein